ncbi:MAG: glycosyltransferase [Burkholderiales bacterium]
MPESIFSGLSLERSADSIHIRYPGRIRPVAQAAGIAAAFGLEILPYGNTGDWSMRVPASGGELPAGLKAFFAKLNGHPQPYPALIDDRAARHAAPLVSCIIVVTENLLFVREQLLPSLAENSGSSAIEVILVCNGTATYDPGLSWLRGIRSEFGAVSVAYNHGAAIARGRFLAFFHDDCVIDDPLWIEKCTQRLQRGGDVVAGEYRELGEIAGIAFPPLPVAKSVPLFMRRADFEETGGYDEFHYIGYEDLDFTLDLAKRGKHMVATDLRLRHYNGMSSTLKYNPVPGLAELYALAALPRAAIRARFREFMEFGADGAVDLATLRLAMDVQLRYAFEKHRDFLSGIDAEAYARAAGALSRSIAARSSEASGAILARFRETDRAHFGEARAKQ